MVPIKKKNFFFMGTLMKIFFAVMRRRADLLFSKKNQRKKKNFFFKGTLMKIFFAVMRRRAKVWFP